MLTDSTDHEDGVVYRNEEKFLKGIKGKSIIVTGGSSGIGQAAAFLFTENGAKVTIADVNGEDGESTVAEIGRRGGEAQFVRTEISNASEVEAMVQKAVARYGRLDGAFNNAGIPNAGKRLHELNEKDYLHCLAVNLNGVFYCLKYEIAQMLKTGGGAIVNTASVAGLICVPGTVEYTTSKHGLVGLTKAAAVDYGQDGIRVNAIAPGTVDTPLFRKGCEINPSLEEYCKKVHPIGRFSQSIEQAQTAMWLLSDAASFVTGAIVPVDGGYTAI